MTDQNIVLTVPNRHCEACGPPPGLIATADQYTAYFENQVGEQLVFTYDRVKKEGTLWHGDYSWEHPVEVVAGNADLILSDEEALWLKLVWEVATKQPISSEFVAGAGNGNQGYYDIEAFTRWQVDVPLTVPKEQVVRMLAGLLSAGLGKAGVDRTLNQYRKLIEQSVDEARRLEADHEITSDD